MGRKHEKTAFDKARDELMSHIHRCGVLDATEDQQTEWMTDTMDFIRKRHPELSKREMDELRQVGERFCRPPIPHGREHTAVATDDATAA